MIDITGHKKVGERTKGVSNKTTIELRTILRAAISNEIQILPGYFEEIEDPQKRIEVLIKLMPYASPKTEAIDLIDAKEKDPFEWD